METEVEYKVSSQQPDLDKVLEKINEIAKASATGDYIYRGETKCYEKVSSNLYREYEVDIKAEHFDIAVVQEKILKEAKEYTHQTSDLEILTQLQHYGGKTNLIDFTTDYLVALFFACDGNPDKPGRVILLQKQSETYEVIPAPRMIARAGVHKSIFVQSRSGVVESDTVVYIPADLKGAMLDYLQKHHGILTKTIYNDLHGFIEGRKFHNRAYATFHKGLTSQDRADSAKTEAERQGWYNDVIKHYTEAIGLNPEDASVYNNRGIVYRNTGDFDAAIEDYSKAIKLDPDLIEVYSNRGVAYADTGNFDAAIEDFNKAIELDPEDADAYYNRGEAWLHISEWQKAKLDLTTAKDMGINIIEAFHNVYESVEAFEAQHGVQVPEDIPVRLEPEELYQIRMEALFGIKNRSTRLRDLSEVELQQFKSHKQALFGMQEGKCKGCQVPFHFRNMTIDHIHPRSKGGTDDPNNLQLLCAMCNSTKGDRTQEYLMRKLIEQGVLRE